MIMSIRRSLSLLVALTVALVAMFATLPFAPAPAGAAVSPFRVTPRALEFGPVLVGAESPPQSVVVTNVSAQPAVANVSGVGAYAPFQSTDGCAGQTLAPGASCAITLRFAPAVAGTVVQTPFFTVGGSLFGITVGGTGVAPRFFLDRTSIDFGPVAVGALARTEKVVVRNVTPASVPIVYGRPNGIAPFSTTSGCRNATLASGAACTVQVGFVPPSVGAFSTTASITISGKVHTVALRGVGVAPTLRITPRAINFGAVLAATTQSRPVVVTNQGADTVTLGNVTAPLAAPFALESDSCTGAVLAPGATCSISFAFLPAARGSVSTTTALDVGGTFATIGLRGTGATTLPNGPAIRVAASSLDLGTVLVGSESEEQFVELKNVSAGFVTTDLDVGVAPAPFSRSEYCPSVLAPGETCHIGFRIEPKVAQASVGSVGGTINGQPFSVALRGRGVTPRLVVTSTALDSGPVLVGASGWFARTEVRNASVAAVELDMAGWYPGAGWGAWNSCLDAVLAPGQRCVVDYWIVPGKLGTATKSLDVSLMAGAPSATVVLRGAGARPNLLVTPRALHFGTVAVGASGVPQTTTVTNLGPWPVKPTVTGLVAPPFSVTNGCQYLTLAVGHSCALSFGFAPTASGTWNVGAPMSVAGIATTITLRGTTPRAIGQ